MNTFKVKNFYLLFPFIIIFLGLLLRINLYINENYTMYQHDLKGHIDNIRYYADNKIAMPQSNKSLQYPQQPLYYLITAYMYNQLDIFNLEEDKKFEIIRGFSIILAFFWLFFGYRFIKLFTKDIVYISIFISFLAFTPSFVFMGARINNDVLNATLGIISLYYIFTYFKRPGISNFMYVLIVVQLAVLTKISSLIFALTFALIILIHYFYFIKLKSKRFKDETIKSRLFFFSVITIFIFGLALIKVYLPATGEFRFVNGYLFFNQIIPSLDFSYFLSFDLFELVKTAYSNSLVNDTIRFSFLTYQYGTMFTGEYNYSYLYSSKKLLILLTQLIYIFGLIYVLGFVSYLFTFIKQSFFIKLLLIPVVINLILIINFLSSYWVVCNSDFRYYSPVFGALGLIFILGLKTITDKYPNLKKVIILYMILFYLIQIAWNIYLVN